MPRRRLKRRVRKWKGCSVEVHRGRLSLRFYHDGKRHRFPLGLPVDKDEVAAGWAGIVAKLVEAGQDPFPTLRKHFHLDEPQPREEPPAAPGTVEGLGREWLAWLAEQPNVRAAKVAKSRAHLESYVFPHVGDFILGDVRPKHLDDLQTTLLKTPLSAHALKRRPARVLEDEGERATLSVKTVKNVFATFRAFAKWANRRDYIDAVPFDGMSWGRVEHPDPLPFDPAERDAIVGYFDSKPFRSQGKAKGVHKPFAALVYLLFWTGLRPSEAAALKWGHVDLARGTADVKGSRHLRQEAKTKTIAARRTIELLPGVVTYLKAIQPLKARPTDHVFTNLRGEPIEPGAFSEHWYDCLRALGIRQRGLYQTKHTFCTLTLSKGGLARVRWLEGQTGEPYLTLIRHYAKWLPSDDASRAEIERELKSA